MSKRDLAFFSTSKKAGRPIVMLTCYDYPTALIEEAAGVDVVLVGDSVGTNVLGYDSERDVTLADIRHHLRAVRRGVKDAFLLADLPYGTYETPALARDSARRLLDDGADGVKLEGWREQASVVRALADDGIAVCAHLGYTPQRHTAAKVRGRTAEEGRELVEGALLLERAGAVMAVLELTAIEASRAISAALAIPTVGIGAGPHCDGQVLVVNDLLGVTPRSYRHNRRYQEFATMSAEAVGAYAADVLARRFPTDQNGCPMNQGEAERLQYTLEMRGERSRA